MSSESNVKTACKAIYSEDWVVVSKTELAQIVQTKIFDISYTRVAVWKYGGEKRFECDLINNKRGFTSKWE